MCLLINITVSNQFTLLSHTWTFNSALAPAYACGIISYNHSGRVCVLEEEPCVTTNKKNDLSMMLLRSTHISCCLEWMPFNKTHCSRKGFPKRAIQIPRKKNRRAVVARHVSINGLRTGMSTSYMRLIQLILKETSKISVMGVTFS